MDSYQFIASIVQSFVSLAWPAALVICVWLFREKLNELLPRFRAKYKDVEVSFRLDQAEKEVLQLPTQEVVPEEASEPTPEEKTKFDSLVDISPRAAVLELRSELEETVQHFAELMGVSKSAGKGMMQLTRILRNTEKIDATTSALLDDLRAVGNSVAHPSNNFTPDKKLATRYRTLVNAAIRRLRFHELRDDPDKKPIESASACIGQPSSRNE
jgi:hypothetical protein